MLFRFDKNGRRHPMIRRTLIRDTVLLVGVAVTIIAVAGTIVHQMWDVDVWRIVAQAGAVIGFGIMSGMWWWVRGTDLNAEIKWYGANRGIDYNATGEE